MRKNSAVIDSSNNTVAFHDGLIAISLQCFNSIKNCACVHRTVCIPAFAKVIVPVRLPKNYRGTEVLLKHLQNNLTLVLVGRVYHVSAKWHQNGSHVNFYTSPRHT